MNSTRQRNVEAPAGEHPAGHFIFELDERFPRSEVAWTLPAWKHEGHEYDWYEGRPALLAASERLKKARRELVFPISKHPAPNSLSIGRRANMGRFEHLIRNQFMTVASGCVSNKHNYHGAGLVKETYEYVFNEVLCVASDKKPGDPRRHQGGIIPVQFEEKEVPCLVISSNRFNYSQTQQGKVYYPHGTRRHVPRHILIVLRSLDSYEPGDEALDRVYVLDMGERRYSFDLAVIRAIDASNPERVRRGSGLIGNIPDKDVTFLLERLSKMFLGM